ncbi:YggS family pyridoxal phosphate-dependent enzyme [Aminiphilus circumscriptus]|uniref:YggS family pyridoxal phosphate-dependent enzyme n=1 Tax=Aminiphilus circumscriptus TaxID=290732 RepID=UPI00049234D1|nr:YggS family pyridoxal phosphate-dependent enzyme [Aminiphilus circumscriptus]
MIRNEDVATMVRRRIREVRECMAEAAEQACRDVASIRLVAVSKYHPVSAMIAAALGGADVLGESRVQEALAKRPAWEAELRHRGVPQPWIPWHLVGHLQRNKARKAMELFSCIQSVDSARLGEDLSRIAGEDGRTLSVLLEVNTSGEASKHGVPPEAAPALTEHLLEKCPFLSVEGLMTVGPLEGGERETAAAFVRLRTLRDDLARRFGHPFPELSMGMSGDFALAIREGSTMVRIGSAIFGPRGGTEDV